MKFSKMGLKRLLNKAAERIDELSTKEVSPGYEIQNLDDHQLAHVLRIAAEKVQRK